MRFSQRSSGPTSMAGCGWWRSAALDATSAPGWTSTSYGHLPDGTEAAAAGLASRVYDDADFEEQAGEVLRVLAEASPSALAFTKQQFYQLDGLGFEEGLRLGADVNAVSRSTPDFRAALSAFLKK